MANKIVTLKDSTGTDNCYPITPVDAVFVDSNTSLSNVLDDKADKDMSNVPNGSIPAGKVDFSTVPHVIACGTKSYAALAAQAAVTIDVEIPTQPDTDYYISLAKVNNGAYWTKLYLTVREGSKTTSGFKVMVYNDDTGGHSATAGYFDYTVVRNN